MVKKIILMVLLTTLSACQTENIAPESKPTPAVHIQHQQIDESPAQLPARNFPNDTEIPLPVKQIVTLSPPKKLLPENLYTVIVDQVPVREILFSLARDAQLNMDLDDNIRGTVTLNAVSQTLQQILKRVARQANIRYIIEPPNLMVTADKPYLEIYHFHYLNLSRDTKSSINLATQISSTGSRNTNQFGNNSTTSITTVSNNKIWDSVIGNIEQILQEGSILAKTTIIESTESGNINAENNDTNTTLEPGKISNQSEETNRTIVEGQTSVIANRESGVIMVRATQRQHKDVGKLLDEVSSSIRRQVLIEATVVEVRLDDQHQQGVDWSAILNSGGLEVVQSLLGTTLGTAPFTAIGVDSEVGDFNINSTVRLLNKFGDTRVLSSPKIMALNNQNAILKVVDNIVYFTIDVETTINETILRTTFESTINTVPVGFVMSVMPYISEADEIILNVRPTLSRILRLVDDPNPNLANARVNNQIPEIQVREMESVLRMNSGQVAVLGGLMQDTVEDRINQVPLLGKIPILGNLFRSENKVTTKTELIVFMRPTIIRNPDVRGELKHLQYLLPDEKTLDRNYNYRGFKP